MHPEEKIYGVDCRIDAVGYQAYSRQNPNEYHPSQVLLDLANIINPTGRLGIIGVYPQKDPRASTEYEKQGLLLLPWGALWTKGVTIMTGQAPVKNYHAYLRDLIISGKARPSFIVSDHIDIDQASQAYMAFDKRDEVTKAIIMF